MKITTYIAPVLEHSQIWQRTLAAQEGGDPLVEKDKEALRSIFFKFRERAEVLVSLILKDLPEFTVHDVTHLDALWEMADVVAGTDYSLSPLEGFVFGGAVLLHDAAMSLSAYPGGLKGLKGDPTWSDGVVAAFRAQGLGDPDQKQIQDPPPEIFTVVLSALLRGKHAVQAESLATQGWVQETGSEPVFLISDQEARKHLGPLIGRIAHSHWWGLDRIEREFAHPINPPAWCRYAGAIRPMIVACLLRCADAIHLDARRAPHFKSALVQPKGESALHWSFQARLTPPLPKDGAVYFTGGPFPRDEYNAWWLCHDTLQMASLELEGVHTLLSHRQLPAFASSRIYGIHNLERLSELITTRGWQPVDTRIRTSNLPEIILELGGNALYLEKRWSVVRELIQNAADAVRARRAIEGRSETWGTITVSVSTDEETNTVTLKVSDSGIGMTELVIRDYLLDFFRSYWSSADAVQQFKGTLRNFKPTGSYGIGFYSVFTIARRVHIRTKSSLDYHNTTRVLLFENGLADRPLLRPAEGEESLADFGTIIELELLSPEMADSIIGSAGVENWPDLLAFVAPALDVQLIYKGDKEETVIEPNDWRWIDPEQLLCRINPGVKKLFQENTENLREEEIWKAEYARHLARSLTEVAGADNRGLGRVCIDTGINVFNEDGGYTIATNAELGALVCGGLRVDNLPGLAGIVEGRVEDASRNRGFVEIEVLHKGNTLARMEGALVSSLKQVDREILSDKTVEMAAIRASQFLLYLGYSVRDLWVAWHQKRGYLRIEDLEFLSGSDIVYIIGHVPVKKVLKKMKITKKKMIEILEKSSFGRSSDFIYVPARLADNVLVIPQSAAVAFEVYRGGEHDRLVTKRLETYEMVRLAMAEAGKKEDLLNSSSYRSAGVAFVAKRFNSFWGGTDKSVKVSIENDDQVEIPAEGEEPITTDAWLIRRVD